MKRVALPAIAALVLAGYCATTAVSESSINATPNHHASPPPTRCTIEGFRPFSAAVWRFGAWKRGNPPRAVIRAQRSSLSCAVSPSHRAAMKRTWRRDAAAFFAHRRHMIWIETYKPFVYPSGKRWAVPYPIAVCESGENYFVGPSGAYGLIPPFPQYMSPHEQDRVAHDLYLEQGEAPWSPYESGCYLR